MKYVTIQPAEQPGGKRPKPYHIQVSGAADEVGLVGRQDYWKGRPLRLIGFTVVPTLFEIAVSAEDFAADPNDAVVGMYPVFEHDYLDPVFECDDDGNPWYTEEIAISSVSDVCDSAGDSMHAGA